MDIKPVLTKSDMAWIIGGVFTVMTTWMGLVAYTVYKLLHS